ncbi:MAG: beta-galactosidase [Bacteroidales bacterium]|nr:beta-galactosidase [Bacteroidales bacterium]
MKQLIIGLMIFAALLFAGCGNSGGKKGTFAAGDKTFLLNGKPFLVKAAEVHYSRIPKEYWENRIQLCKALGMNTLCIYIFWNYHEMEEGVFDFTGNKDIAEFCRLAQKNGMYIIVRPGPYVCAEWEMGGLPWWLLKNDSIQLRTLDADYMNHVEKFMAEVGKQLGPLQITNGGNIIMVQVENEYGSYGIDKPYISAIRDIVKKSGFDQVPLFQCDWSSNFTNNALDDLLWTVNFGTGSDIDAQFKKLKELRPNTPLMCSEFWSGWFDHWGRPHETRPADVMVSGLQEMIEKNISFSLYMTHGGTTFGFWGGANNPAYSAMCSSYDYDAPISENGQVTPKYMLLREMMQNHLQEGETLADIPQQIKAVAVPEFQLTEMADVFDNLPQAIETEDIKPMEKFNQGWGSILYRKQLDANVNKGTEVKITEVHDYALVFVNGNKIAELDRRKGEFSFVLNEDLKQGDILDIYIEALGRVNFDKSIHDRKGITESVTIGGTELKNWQVFLLPLDYNFALNKKYSAVKSTNKPAYYKGEFTLDKAEDTFLDFSTWGKGFVWVNGYALGRIWQIGPQQTLYMPGCWLKEGKNEIVVLDILGANEPKVQGLDKPILDMLRVAVPQTHRKDGEKLNLTKEQPVIAGELKNVSAPQTIEFAKPVSGRYLCIEALNNFTGDNITSLAEVDAFDKNGKLINRKDWSIVYADSEETRSGEYTADKLYDLQESTYWQTVDNVAFPHAVVIDFGKNETIKSIRIIPRQEKGNPGLIKEFRIFVKDTEFLK